MKSIIFNASAKVKPDTLASTKSQLKSTSFKMIKTSGTLTKLAFQSA